VGSLQQPKEKRRRGGGAAGGGGLGRGDCLVARESPERFLIVDCLAAWLTGAGSE
jgi:hypothetical protein